MDGSNKPNANTLLAKANTTPTQNQRGVEHKTLYVPLVTYEVNVRSFHPNKNFEPLGFRFHGDNRGFSTGASWFGKKTEEGQPTSRIWQRYTLDTACNAPAELSSSASPAKLATESNPSAPGPGAWGALGHTEPYKDRRFKPRGSLQITSVTEPHGSHKIFRLKSYYGGENHAFLSSETLQKVFGGTVVPTLDVFNELFVRIERIRGYMDIISLTYGDGFPNCESFIKDPAGNVLMLGTHVRIGFPATHLWNKNQRLMWANAIRVRLDDQGNFGNDVWVFTQALSGSPELRDEYPTNKYGEVCSTAVSKPELKIETIATPNRPATYAKLVWNCGKVSDISNANSPLPLYLSAFADVSAVRKELEKTWLTPPAKKTTRAGWNDAQLHREPNGGRAKDDYDLAKEKWQTPKK